MSDVVVTGTDQRAAWDLGVMPPVEQVRPGLWSIPVPIPNNPLRYVLVYALEAGNGICLVDAGWNTDSAFTALTEGLSTAGMALSDVTAVLVTHIHPDHYGLAGRVREASGAWVGLHPADAALIPGRYGAGMEEVLRAMRRLMTDNGVPDDVVHELSDASLGIRDFVDAVEPDVMLEDGTRVDIEGIDLTVVHTPGHSPGHVCFYEAGNKLLLSGDHVLPRISPSISVHAQQVDNPLADFLDSLKRVGALDVTDVLPAHQWRFSPLDVRVAELLSHHAERLEQTRQLIESTPEATCWDITGRMTWSRPWDEVRGFMRRAAVGETLAHLVLLESRGTIVRVAGQPVRWRLA